MDGEEEGDYDIFRDDEDDPDGQNCFQNNNDSNKEFVVYLVDASPNMFVTTSSSESEEESHFQIALGCISDSLKAMIINKSLDQIAICFFNTVCNVMLTHLLNKPPIPLFPFLTIPILHYLHCRKKRRIYKT
jgi:hypothetical protein